MFVVLLRCSAMAPDKSLNALDTWTVITCNLLHDPAEDVLSVQMFRCYTDDS